MSSGCPLINESNYATYDTKYNTYTADGKPLGSCIDNATSKKYVNNTGCNQDEFACYANHKLSKMRTNLDSNLAEIYQPQNSKIANEVGAIVTTLFDRGACLSCFSSWE